MQSSSINSLVEAPALNNIIMSSKKGDSIQAIVPLLEYMFNFSY